MDNEQQKLFSDIKISNATCVSTPIEHRPLADLLRPDTLDDFLGQEHIIGKGTLLRQALEQGKLFPFILWGPPGSGKTTLARLTAKYINARFIEFSAVVSGIPEVKKVIADSELLLKRGKRTVVFIDEIHRFNKAQQDAFLPHVERGTITLIGATTENPYFEVIAPLLSRVRVFKLQPLNDSQLEVILNNALETLQFNMQKNACELLIAAMDGDARRLLNLVEALSMIVQKDDIIDIEQVKTVLVDKTVMYDKKGDYHYDIISAFIKSLRGSDPDAALHWLARMITAGEDPRFIVRRMIVFASEDIGNAAPMAILIANAAADALEYVGMPEARIPLAQAVCYLASAPKSNASYLAINKAMDDVKNKPIGQVPLHLRNPVFDKAKEFGFGEGYKYPHDFSGHFVKQDYLPPELSASRYYFPSCEGEENKIKDRLESLWDKYQ